MRFPSLCLVLVLALPAAAQSARSTTTGISLALHGAGVSVSIREAALLGYRQTNYGAGGGGGIGFGISRVFGVFVNGSGAWVNAKNGARYTVGVLDVGARASLASPARVLVPYVEGEFTGGKLWLHNVAASYAGFTVRGDATASGSGFGGGVGGAYFVSPAWALDAALLFTHGRFDKVTVAGIGLSGLDVGTNLVRLRLGASWHPGAPRGR